MIAKLNIDNILQITKGQTINSNVSMRNSCSFYIPKKVKEMNVKECDVILFVVNRNKEIVSTALVETISDESDYLKYQINEKNDFAVTEGVYSGYLIVFNPETRTHISSTSIRFIAVDGSDADLTIAMSANVIDETLLEITAAKHQMQDMLKKMTQLTQMNININNEIRERLGDS